MAPQPPIHPSQRLVDEKQGPAVYKVYAVLLLLALALLLMPSVRRSLGGLAGLGRKENRQDLARSAREQARTAAEQARAAAGTARQAAGTAADVARGTAGAVRDAGDSLSQTLTDRRLRTIGRTVTAEGGPGELASLLAEAVATVAVVDPVAPREGETQAWVHSGTGDTRYAARPGPATAPTTVVGVVEFEVVMGEPQGASVTGHVLEAVTEALDRAGIRWTEAVHPFTPGPADTTDGFRRLT
ncbi:hypothetical protein [Lapillicoccus jejuensis]|uniref:hypothetical protein n=1 Tax=Lapillicoccus jejuensis TaxID=402171 RepID=UPI001153E045|nr:hypothetical protein [Lapillicoccus jejuensis]